MPIPNRNGYYTGQMFTNELGERYVWIGSEWKTAGNDNYTPVSAAREVNITFNTFLEEGGNSVQAKVLVNDNEWADSSSQNGKITIKFFDYQILNPTKISFIGTNVKAKKTFIVQSKVNQENEVVVREADQFGNPIDNYISTPFTPPIEVNPIAPPFFNTGGGSGGGGGMREVNPIDFRGAAYGLADDVTQRENIR